jgi:hypothetical protein
MRAAARFHRGADGTRAGHANRAALGFRQDAGDAREAA